MDDESIGTKQKNAEERDCKANKSDDAPFFFERKPAAYKDKAENCNKRRAGRKNHSQTRLHILDNATAEKQPC